MATCARDHPLDRATAGEVSIANFCSVTLSNENNIVDQVLYMLQGLETELFALKSSVSSQRESEIDAPVLDALLSKDFERLWTWTTTYEVELASLTSISMNMLLEHFMAYATTLSKLRAMCKTAGAGGFGFTCLVLAQDVSKYLQDCQRQFYSVQQMHQKRPLTLLRLHQLLAEQKSQAEWITRLVNKSLQPLPDIDYAASVDDLYPDRPKPSKAERAARIFRVLEETMDEADDDKKLRFAYMLFLNVLRQYLDKIDHWMDLGYLSPSDRDEFCIVCLSDDAVTSSIFWDAKFRAASSEVPSFLSLSIDRILATGKASLMIAHLQQSESTKNQPSLVDREAKTSMVEPLFAKAKRLLSSHFESTWETFYTADSYQRASKLPAIISSIPQSKGDTKPPVVHASPSSTVGSSAESSAVLSSRSTHPLDLDLNSPAQPSRTSQQADVGTALRPFSLFFASERSSDSSSWPSCFKAQESTIGRAQVQNNASTDAQVLEKVACFGVPISSVLSSCIAQPIADAYERINGSLMNLLIQKCHILEHLETAQRYFFIANPLSDLFALSVMPTLWNHISINEVILNQWLGQATEAIYVNNPTQHRYSNLVSLHILPRKVAASPSRSQTEEDAMKVRSMRSMEDFSRIWINFEATWPVSLFITNETHDMYNSITTALANLMAAQYVLEQLITMHKGRDIKTLPLMHPMLLFRNELLTLVRSIRTYMVSRIQQVPWDELEAKLRAAKDLDEMRATHFKFLQTIRERCLLTDSVLAVKRAIDRILSIAIDFARQYQLLHSSLNPSSMSSAASTSTDSPSKNKVFAMGEGIDSSSQTKLVVLTKKMHAEFLRLHGFICTVILKMSATSTTSHLSDLLVRLDFSEYYQKRRPSEAPTD